MNEEKLIQRDRMRFVKNTMCANLCYLAILFDIFYFVLLYRSDVGTYYYTIQIGASIVYNLLFLLIVFLSSEEVKNYNKTYSYILLAVGVMQIVRIFVIPMDAHAATILVQNMETGAMEETAVMGNSQFFWSVIHLAVSAACLIVSAVVNIIRCSTLEAHNKYLESQKA